MATRRKPRDFGAFTAQLLDAHARGASDDVAALLTLVDRFDDDVLRLTMIDSASFIWWEDVPTPEQEEDFSLFEHVIDAERLEEVQAGAPLTPDEQTAWARAAVEAIFTDEVDADVYPTWCLATLSDDAGRSAVLAFLVYGYSVSGITLDAIGLFDDQSAALAALKARGITSQEDYEQHLANRTGS